MRNDDLRKTSDKSCMLDYTSKRNQMHQIAIYGKGGIGKSTITANMSYILSTSGHRVTQIGCDPKHDSTRLLLGGRTQNTVLDYLRHTPKEDRSLDDVVFEGSGGVRCIEAGGPEPGVGCAGRGILTMFDFLDSSGLESQEGDFRIYDVLGDVVCGGFAVPLRKGYADAVYIVTSGEFMSLYAANNILKGLLNYDDGRPRVGGIVLNSRGMSGEEEYVRNFADVAGLPIVSVIPRDPLFAEAESMGKTVAEAFPGSDTAKALFKVADDIVSKSTNRELLRYPRPLSDDAMDMVAKGIPLSGETTLDYRRIRNPVNDCWSLKTCAGMGAVAYTRMVRGVHTVVHGPTSCAYMMCCRDDQKTLLRDLQGDGRGVWEDVSCTCLDNSASVFGGVSKLKEHVRARAAMGDDCIMVVSMCVPGIIGDNIVDACAELSDELGIEVIPVPVDGIGAGAASSGIRAVVDKMVELAEDCDEKDPGLINVMGDYRSATEHMACLDRSVDRLLADAGFRVNTRYPGECTIEDIRRMRRAAFAVRSFDERTNRLTCEDACRRMGITLMQRSLPKGMVNIRPWLDEVEELTGRDLDNVKTRMSEEYETRIEPVRKRTEGRTAVVVTRPSSDYSWLFGTLDDLGIEVLRARESTYNRWLMGQSACDDKEPYMSRMVQEDADELRPDIVLSDSMADLGLRRRYWRVVAPHPGLDGIVDWAERLGRAMDAPEMEAWR